MLAVGYYKRAQQTLEAEVDMSTQLEVTHIQTNAQHNMFFLVQCRQQKQQAKIEEMEKDGRKSKREKSLFSTLSC